MSLIEREALCESLYQEYTKLNTGSITDFYIQRQKVRYIMNDLISRQAALDIVMCYCPDDDGSCSKAGHDIREMLDELEALPTIKAEPVRHAYWEPSEVGEYHCTNCGAECDIDKFHKALLKSFCGNCGADMREVSEDV